MTLMAILQFGILVEGALSSGAGEGLTKLFSDWDTSLSDPGTWVAGTVQALISLSLASGTIITLSSRTKVNNHLLRDIGIVFVSNILVGLLSVFTVYVWVGVVEQQLDEKLEFQHWTSPMFAVFAQGVRIKFGSNYRFALSMVFLYIVLSSVLTMVSICINS